MKKLIPFLLSAILLTGCHGGANQDNSAPEQTTIVTTAQTTSVTETTAVTSTTAATTTTTTTSTETQSTAETTSAPSTEIIQTVAEPAKNAETEGETEMKEEYITPEIEVTEFDEEDVITTSNQAKINDDNSIDLPIIPIK